MLQLVGLCVETAKGGVDDLVLLQPMRSLQCLECAGNIIGGKEAEGTGGMQGGALPKEALCLGKRVEGCCVLTDESLTLCHLLVVYVGVIAAMMT